MRIDTPCTIFLLSSILSDTLSTPVYLASRLRRLSSQRSTELINFNEAFPLGGHPELSLYEPVLLPDHFDPTGRSTYLFPLEEPDFDEVYGTLGSVHLTPDAPSNTIEHIEHRARTTSLSQGGIEQQLWGCMPQSLIPEEHRDITSISLNEVREILQSAERKSSKLQPGAHEPKGSKMIEAAEQLPSKSSPKEIFDDSRIHSDAASSKAKKERESVGMTSQSLSKDPSKIKILESNQMNCAICLESYKAPHREENKLNGEWKFEIIRKPGTCDHYFHPNCIKKWLEHANSCPSCRGPIIN